MKLKRYELHQTQYGASMRPDDLDGEWVDADEAQAAIESLQHDLDLYRDSLQSVVTSELPESELDPVNPGDFVHIEASHLDHESYRDAARVAAALIGMKRIYD